MKTIDVNEKVRRCVAKHPDWHWKRIASATGGHKPVIEAILRGEPVPELTPAPAPGPVDSSAPGCISLSAVRDKLDIAAMIRREVNRIPRGQLMPEDDLCRLTAGRDRNRFRRAVENNADCFRAHRVRLRLDESTEGKWYWGQAPDVAEAIRIRDL